MNGIVINLEFKIPEKNEVLSVRTFVFVTKNTIIEQNFTALHDAVKTKMRNMRNHPLIKGYEYTCSII